MNFRIAGNVLVIIQLKWTIESIGINQADKNGKKNERLKIITQILLRFIHFDLLSAQSLFMEKLFSLRVYDVS